MTKNNRALEGRIPSPEHLKPLDDDEKTTVEIENEVEDNMIVQETSEDDDYPNVEDLSHEAIALDDIEDLTHEAVAIDDIEDLSDAVVDEERVRKAYAMENSDQIDFTVDDLIDSVHSGERTVSDIQLFAKRFGVEIDREGNHVSGNTLSKQEIENLQSAIQYLHTKAGIDGIKVQTENPEQARNTLVQEMDQLVEDIKSEYGVKITRDSTSARGYNIQGFFNKRKFKKQEAQVQPMLEQLYEKHLKLTDLNDQIVSETPNFAEKQPPNLKTIRETFENQAAANDDKIEQEEKLKNEIKELGEEAILQRTEKKMSTRASRLVATGFAILGALGLGGLAKEKANFDAETAQLAKSMTNNDISDLKKVRYVETDNYIAPQTDRYDMKGSTIEVKVPRFVVGKNAPDLSALPQIGKEKTYTFSNTSGESYNRRDIVRAVTDSTLGTIVKEKTYTKTSPNGNPENIGQIFTVQDGENGIVKQVYTSFDNEKGGYTIDAVASIDPGTNEVDVVGKISPEIRTYLQNFGRQELLEDGRQLVSQK